MALIDRVKFDAPRDDILVWKFPSEELALGSQLIVNQSQEAIFVKGGKALDVFGPGTHTLSSGNLPLLQRLVNLPFGGKTPFTAEVWYVNKTVKRDLKWGTMSPIPIIDPQYGIPISVRAFGRWGLRVNDTRSFISQIVGTQVAALADKIEEYFEGEIVQRLSDALAKYFVVKKISIFEANAHLNDLSASVASGITPEFERFGIEIVNFNVERVSIPEEEQKKIQDVLARRMEIDQISQAKVGQAYTTMRTFDTLEKAAGAEGTAGQLLASGLGLGVGIGAGVPIGQQLGQALQPSANPPQPATSQGDPTTRLKTLKELLDAGAITKDEFDAKRKQIIDSI